jgi:hypothetical protein
MRSLRPMPERWQGAGAIVAMLAFIAVFVIRFPDTGPGSDLLSTSILAGVNAVVGYGLTYLAFLLVDTWFKGN